MRVPFSGGGGGFLECFGVYSVARNTHPNLKVYSIFRGTHILETPMRFSEYATLRSTL